ncbi:hypothetical protein GCM10010191_95730 [Actinomadura vinacea]|uniref:Uncharacterized protein n=2 Tax=Actinomadura vinacea TaxID=115336 RepID=A0ABN3KMF0_9ACTN
MEGAEADEELQSLHDWLLAEPKIRRHARVSLRSAPARPGEMGTVLDAIQVAVEDGFQAAELVLAYLAWRAARGGKANGTIERGNTKIPLSETTDETAESVAKKLDSDES